MGMEQQGLRWAFPLRRICQLFLRLAALIVILGYPLFENAVRGGGGPENVLLVVNPRSQTSLTVANHYQFLRNIPGENVLYLPRGPEGADHRCGALSREDLGADSRRDSAAGRNRQDRLRGLLGRLPLGN